jgi:hypothetical protein
MAVPGRISAGRAGPAESAWLPETKVRTERRETRDARKGRRARFQMEPQLVALSFPHQRESKGVARPCSCPLSQGMSGGWRRVGLGNGKNTKMLSFYRITGYDAGIVVKAEPVGFKAFLNRESACDESAKQNAGQPIENKQSGEIPDFAPPMISMTCAPRRETLGFVRRNNSFRFRWFWPPRRPKRNGPRRASDRGVE